MPLAILPDSGGSGLTAVVLRTSKTSPSALFFAVAHRARRYCHRASRASSREHLQGERLLPCGSYGDGHAAPRHSLASARRRSSGMLGQSGLSRIEGGETIESSRAIGIAQQYPFDKLPCHRIAGRCRERARGRSTSCAGGRCLTPKTNSQTANLGARRPMTSDVTPSRGPSVTPSRDVTPSYP